jgi:hypothetical protein
MDCSAHGCPDPLPDWPRCFNYPSPFLPSRADLHLLTLPKVILPRFTPFTRLSSGVWTVGQDGQNKDMQCVDRSEYGLGRHGEMSRNWLCFQRSSGKADSGGIYDVTGITAEPSQSRYGHFLEKSRKAAMPVGNPPQFAIVLTLALSPDRSTLRKTSKLSRVARAGPRLSEALWLVHHDRRYGEEPPKPRVEVR